MPLQHYSHLIHSLFSYGHVESLVSEILQWCLRDRWHNIVILKGTVSRAIPRGMALFPNCNCWPLLLCFMLFFLVIFWCSKQIEFFLKNKLLTGSFLSCPHSICFIFQCGFQAYHWDWRWEKRCLPALTTKWFLNWSLVLDLKCYCTKIISKSWSFTDDQSTLVIW